MYTVLFIGGFFAKYTVSSAKFAAVQVLQPEGRRGSFQSPKIMTQVEKKSNILGEERLFLWEPSMQIREDADTTGQVSFCKEESLLHFFEGLVWVSFVLQMRKDGTESVTDLPKATQQVNGKAEERIHYSSVGVQMRPSSLNH